MSFGLGTVFPPKKFVTPIARTLLPPECGAQYRFPVPFRGYGCEIRHQRNKWCRFVPNDDFYNILKNTCAYWFSFILHDFHAFSCNFMQAHANSCKLMQAHAISCNLMQSHANSCILMHSLSFSCILMHSHALSFVLMQSYVLLCILM